MEVDWCTLFFAINCYNQTTYLRKGVPYTKICTILSDLKQVFCLIENRGRRGRDRIIVEFPTTCAIGAYHH